MANATERRDVERLFEGERLADGHALAGVARYLDTVQATYGVRSAPAPNRDLAAVLDSGHARGRDIGIVHTRPRPHRSRRVGLIAATLLVTIGATGGLAAASALPNPVQRAVADFAEHFGVHLPQPDLPVPAIENHTAADGGTSDIAPQSAPTASSPPGGATSTSITPTSSTGPVTPTSEPPTIVLPALPSTALPSLPNVPGSGGLTPLLPECRQPSLIPIVHLCRTAEG